MCGIVGFSGMKDAADMLLEGLKRMEYRGYDSAGIAVLDQAHKISVARATGRLSKLCELTDNGKTLPGFAGIGHTRWATHGAPTENNAHPHMSADGLFAVVHNGIIENYQVLKEELTAKGFKFRSDTDTEVVAHLLDMYYDGNLKNTVMKTVARLEGSYGLGILCSEHPDELVCVRNFSPLVVGVGVGENYFASDVTALLGRTRNMIYLDDGEFAVLSPSEIKVYNVLGQAVEKKTVRISWSLEDAEKGGYDHFMLKEINEQPRAVKSAIEPRIKDGRIELDGIEFSDDFIKGINNIVITACGSAYHAGCAGKYIIEELCRVPVNTEIASELRYRNPIIDEHTLTIVISQSGETADTIAAMKECQARGSRALAIVNVVDSSIARYADDVLYTYAGPEIAVATTKGYTTQVAVLSLFAVYLADRLGRISPERYAQLVQDITNLPMCCQRALDLSRNVEEYAKKYHGNSSLFFIGRNLDYAVCLEASLKLKEISYIHSEAYAAGELKHGTIALIEPGRLVVAICCYQPLFDKMMANIKEVKARGAEVMGVALEGDNRVILEADNAIYIPKTDELLEPLVQVIPLQLFAYYVAKANGCDIDKPKNLAKSVTVE